VFISYKHQAPDQLKHGLNETVNAINKVVITSNINYSRKSSFSLSKGCQWQTSSVANGHGTKCVPLLWLHGSNRLLEHNSAKDMRDEWLEARRAWLLQSWLLWCHRQLHWLTRADFNSVGHLSYRISDLLSHRIDPCLHGIQIWRLRGHLNEYNYYKSVSTQYISYFFSICFLVRSYNH
jgi:hypothetical protein